MNTPTANTDTSRLTFPRVATSSTPAATVSARMP